MLMLRIFPPEKRGMAMGIWAMTTLLGPAIGPIIGGAISDNMSWHWIFLINVPVALGCTAAAYALLRPAETEVRKVPIDVVGLGLLIFWIGCLQIVLDLGRDHDWFADPMILTLAILAGLGFIVFVIWELTEEHPVVDLRIFRHRGFTAAVFALALAFGSYFAGIVIIPQWLQSSMGYTATDAGLVTAFTAMSALVTSQIAARMIGRVDARIMVSAAIVWLGFMSLLRAQWTTDADFWTLAMPQILQGFAMSFFIVPLTSISLSAVRPDEIASAAGLQSFLRTMAVAISTSVALTFWGNAERVAHSDIASTLNPDETMTALSGVGVGMEQGRQVIVNIVTQQSTMIAVDQTFVVAGIAMFIAAGLVWLSPPPKKVDTSSAH
jgi:DHA2 family multidrug resistance protein